MAGPALLGRGVGEERERQQEEEEEGAEHLIFAGSRGHVEAVLCGGPYILVPGTPSRRGVGVAWEH